MILVEQLAELADPEAELAEVISLWQGIGLETTAWQSGDIELAYAALWAEMSTRFQNTMVRPTLKAFYADHATGIALTFVADGLFDVQRISAIAAQHNVTLTDDSGGGPHAITLNTVAKDPATGLTFRATAADTIPQSGSVTVVFECEQRGSLGNVSNGSITALTTSITGVSLTNGTVGSDSAITRLGVNAEKDVTLRARCRTKMATLSPNSPISAYENLVLSATDGSGDPVGIVKVWVDASNPGGPGSVYVYVANQTATATAQQVSDVQDYIDDGRVSPAALPTVIAATEVVVDIYGTIYVQRGQGTAAVAAVTTAFTEYIAGNDTSEENIGLPLGGKQLDSDPTGAGFVLTDDLISLAKAVPSVISIQLSSSANIALAGNELAVVGTILLNAIEI